MKPGSKRAAVQDILVTLSRNELLAFELCACARLLPALREFNRLYRSEADRSEKFLAWAWDALLSCPSKVAVKGHMLDSDEADPEAGYEDSRYLAVSQYADVAMINLKDFLLSANSAHVLESSSQLIGAFMSLWLRDSRQKLPRSFKKGDLDPVMELEAEVQLEFLSLIRAADLSNDQSRDAFREVIRSFAEQHTIL